MPKNGVSPSIGEQLGDALAAAGVSQKELARRLAAANGGTVESKRRWILKLLRDEVNGPNMAAVETALNLPRGHFVIPTAEDRERRRVRLAEVEVEFAKYHRMIQSAASAIELLAVRVEALERQVRPGSARGTARP